MEGTNNEYLIEYKTVSKSTNVPIDCLKPGQTRGRQKKRTSRKIRLYPNNIRRKFKIKTIKV